MVRLLIKTTGVSINVVQVHRPFLNLGTQKGAWQVGIPRLSSRFLTGQGARPWPARHLRALRRVFLAGESSACAS